MKTFTATHLNKHAQEVFAAAKEDGSVVIEHSNYFGGVFAIVWNKDTINGNACSKCKQERPKTSSGLSDCCDAYFITHSGGV